jgi:hypothetical protein
MDGSGAAETAFFAFLPHLSGADTFAYFGYRSSVD